jgi:hypothetical protein
MRWYCGSFWGMEGYHYIISQPGRDMRKDQALV